MIIRKATKKDIPIIAEQWYKEEKLESKADPRWKLRKDVKKVILKELKEKFKKKHFIAFVAEDNGKIVGSYQAWIENAYSLLEINKLGHLAVAYVEPEYREKGVAKKLFNEVIKWFKSKNIKFIDGYILNNNKVARKTWSKLGLKDFMINVTKEIK